MQSQKKVIQTFGTVNTKATEASFRVALHIAKAGKPHNTGEILLLPAAKDMCSVMMDEAAAAKLDATLMSDNTIQRCISGMAADVKDAIRESSFFSIQLDESTDVANCAQLCALLKSSVSRRSFCFAILCRRALQQQTFSRL